MTSYSDPILGRDWVQFGAVPVYLYILIFCVMPVVALLTMPFPSWGSLISSLQDWQEQPGYNTSLWSTLKVAILVTLTSTAVGLLLGGCAARTHSRKLEVALLAVGVLPLWTSVLVRNFSLLVLLQDSGPIAEILSSLGIHASLMYNGVGVILGMTHIMTPYSTLFCYLGFTNANSREELAALSLGSSELRAFLSIALPAAAPAVLSSAALVFVLSMGFYVTPALLGGGKVRTVAMLIETEASKFLNWQMAAALSLVLVGSIVLSLLVLLVLATAIRWLARRRLGAR